MTADHVPEERPDDERPAPDGSDGPDGPVGSDGRPTPAEPAADRPPETSDADVDRMFAELIAGWGRTASASDRVSPGDAGPPISTAPATDLASPIGPASAPDDGPQPISWPTRGAEDWAANHPLLARPGPPAPDVPVPPRSKAGDDGPDPAAAPASTWRTPSTGRAKPEDEPYERYRPELHPIGRPRWPIVVGWSAMGLAVVATLLAIVGVPLPTWAGWLAIGGFLGGFGLLVAQLPRHRPPDAGDGAVL